MARRHTRHHIAAKRAAHAKHRKTKSASHRAKHPHDVHVHHHGGVHTVNAPKAW